MSCSARLANSERSTSQAIYQREANRDDVLLCVSVIPSGPRSAEHLLVSYRRHVRCRTPVSGNPYP